MNGRAFASAVLLWVAMATGAFAGTVTTNVWKAASGGDWSDAANWEGATGSAPTSGFFDFSALESGATVNMDMTVDAQGLLFAGAATDTWTISGTGKLHLLNYVPLTDYGPAGELCVKGGKLVFNVWLSQMPSGVIKTGDGTLEIARENHWPAADGAVCLMLSDGRTEVASETALEVVRIKWISSSAELALQRNATIGAFVTEDGFKPNVNLNGHQLTVGGARSTAADVFAGKLGGGGTLKADRMGTLALNESPTVDAVQVGNGDILLGYPGLVARYDFEDAERVAADSSGHGRDLVAVGSPTVVEDPERGKALKLDGKSYLKGPLANDGLEGLPCGGAPVTVGFWYKADADVTKTAGVFGWGKFSTDGACFGFALRNPSPDNNQTDGLFTIWGKNIGLKTGVYDGKWHHFAFIHNNGTFILCVDGAQASSFSAKSSVLNQDFRIGDGQWKNLPLKGCIDDVFIANIPYEADLVYAIAKRGFKGKAALPDGAAVKASLNGTLRLSGGATVSELSGNGFRGGVETAPGAALTVAGGAATNVFKGAVSGDGSLVEKGGAGHRLVLDGVSTYAGETKVESGTLVLRRPVCRDGLVALYSFEDATRPGLDSSAQGYHLDKFEGANPSVISDGVAGIAGHFDGTTFLYPNNRVMPRGFMSDNQPFTISLWMRPTADCCNTRKSGIFQIGETTDSKCVILKFRSATEFLYSNWGNNAGVTGFGNIADGAWHHVVVTYDGGVSRVYVDNDCRLALKPNGGKLNVSGIQFSLGECWYVNPRQHYVGDLDEVQVWNRAWSADEVAAEFERRPAERTDPVAALPQPVAHWTFDDATNPGRDSGPNGYDLAMTGTVSVVTIPNCRGSVLDLRYSFGYLQAKNFPAKIPTGNSPVTISCRFRPEANLGANDCLVFWGETLSDHQQRGQMHLLGAADRWVDDVLISMYMRYTVSHNRGLYMGPTVIAPSPAALRWMHIVTVYDPKYRGYAAYVDGVLCETDERDPVDVPAQSFMIGSKASAPDAHFHGVIDDVQIFDCALTEGEIQTLTRSFMTDEVPPVVPAKTSLDVASGATLVVDGADQQVASLVGSGTVAFAHDGVLSVRGDSTFSGALAGNGSIMPDGCTLILSGDLSAFDGSVALGRNGGMARMADGGAIPAGVKIADGAQIAVESSELDLPLVTATGVLRVGASGTVTWKGSPKPGRYVLAKGAMATGPSDFSGWELKSAEPVERYSFHCRNGQFFLRIPGGMVLCVR